MGVDAIDDKNLALADRVGDHLEPYRRRELALALAHANPAFVDANNTPYRPPSHMAEGDAVSAVRRLADAFARAYDL